MGRYFSAAAVLTRTTLSLGRTSHDRPAPAVRRAWRRLRATRRTGCAPLGANGFADRLFRDGDGATSAGADDP